MTCNPWRITEAGNIEAPAKHQCETAYPEPKHTQGIDHKVHGHGMGYVLFLREPGFNHCETSLHKHYKEAGYQRPHNVNGNFVVPNRIINFCLCGLTRFYSGYVTCVTN